MRFWPGGKRKKEEDKEEYVVEGEGVSVMELKSNRIVFQRDYYDLGEMVYERVPLLGRLVRKLRERLA